MDLCKLETGRREGMGTRLQQRAVGVLRRGQPQRVDLHKAERRQLARAARRRSARTASSAVAVLPVPGTPLTYRHWLRQPSPATSLGPAMCKFSGPLTLNSIP